MSSPRLPIRARFPDFPDGTQACAGADTDAWYPNKGERALTARRICHRCPLKTECLDWAIQTREPHGIWGGLTADERSERRKAMASQYAQAA